MKVKFKQRSGSGVFCHDLLKKTVGFTIPALLDRCDYSDLFMTISLRQKAGSTKNIMGTCAPAYVTDPKNKKRKIPSKNQYFITIDKHLHELDQVSTLIHELVHVKQYVYNELKVTNRGNLRWENKRLYPYKKYENSPWEKEAFFLEDEIFLDFMEFYKDDLTDVIATHPMKYGVMYLR